MRSPLRLTFLGLALALASGSARGATVTIVNRDTAAAGLNDPSPTAPVGGNTGATLGEQRLIALREAARIWGTHLPSGVEIQIDATFRPDDCTESTGVLASAGALTLELDFAGAPRPATHYPAALANRLAGRDLQPSFSDIGVTFNSRVGTPGCLSSRPFYLGLDGNHGTQFDLIAVALHELAHGLGFASQANRSTGNGSLLLGLDDVYTLNLVDGATGKTWAAADSTDAERLASGTSGRLAWNGAAANRYFASFVRGTPGLTVTSPASAAGTYVVGDATFGAPVSLDPVAGQMVAARDAADAAGPSETDGCSALTNASELRGRIALIDRGSCTFVVKARNAQDAGALAMVIADNAAGAVPLGMSGTDPSLTIPSVRITQADGARLRAELPANASLALDPTRPSGLDAEGRVRIYSPNPYEPGSSISHLDVSTSPSTLMEPSVNDDLTHSVDGTLPLFQDLGWFGAEASWILPSSARVSGAGGAFYTTDVTIGNGGAADTDVTLRFLGNNRDGSTGPEKTVIVPSGGFVTFADVLKSAFGIESGFGAIRIVSPSSKLSITSQTSTPGTSGGSFGQSVPAVAHTELGIEGGSREIAGAREDASFRTNLVLVNATPRALELAVEVLDEEGSALGTRTLPLFQPYEMRQVGSVVSAITGRSDVANATLRVRATTPGGSFATYAAVIDNVTNDPRTLLPAPDVTGAAAWILPSSARASGAGGAFYTTDVTLMNGGRFPATVGMRFLGNNRDGRGGPQVAFSLEPGRSWRLVDVLGETFSLSQDYGAIRLVSSHPQLAIVSQTSTPGGGGTFGQSVPALSATSAVVPGYPLRILSAREDPAFRTNLVVANASEATADVDVVAYGAAGSELGRARIAGLRPYEMRQLGRILGQITGRSDIGAASLVVSTSTPGALVTTYAAVIDNVTNDPRTLLAQ